MKNELKIGTIINIAIAILAYIKGNLIAYPLILTGLSIVYLALLEKTSIYFSDKKSQIILLALISLMINPIAGIILLIGQDKIPRYLNETEQENKKQELTQENKKTITLLNLGLGLIGVSGIILATTNWKIMSSITKLLIIITISIIFLILSIISEKKLKIEILSKTYWKISMIFIILSIITNGYLETLSHWFSFYGEGKYLYAALLSIIISLLSLITHNKYGKQIYKRISYIGILASISSIFLHFNLEISIIIIVANILLIMADIIVKEQKIKEILKYITYGTALISIILGITTENILILSILSITTIINIIIKNAETKVENIINPLIINSSLIVTTIGIKEILEIQLELISSLLITLYGIIYLINLLKLKNIDETFKNTFNIITNIVMIITTIIMIDNKLILTYITSMITLTSLLNYYKNTIPFEKILLPIKMTISTISIILLIQESFEINISYVLALIYTIVFIIYKLIKNQKINIIPLIMYYALFIITLITVQKQELLISLINIIAALITTIIISKEENNIKTNTSYILLLLTIASVFAYTNILDTIPLINGIIILLIYIVFTITINKNEQLKKINYLSIILPLIIMCSQNIEPQEISLIIYNLIRIYVVVLISVFLIKKDKDRNILLTILLPIILISVIFEHSPIIGIYNGIISLILILLGYINKEYKGLYIEGIVITIINIVIQLEYIFEELPLWIYTLLAGFIIIGVVTYKAIKENK